MVREFSIVQSTVVEGLDRNRTKNIGVVAEFFFAKSARCFTPVIEIKPNTFSPQ